MDGVLQEQDYCINFAENVKREFEGAADYFSAAVTGRSRVNLRL